MEVNVECTVDGFHGLSTVQYIGWLLKFAWFFLRRQLKSSCFEEHAVIVGVTVTGDLLRSYFTQSSKKIVCFQLIQQFLIFVYGRIFKIAVGTMGVGRIYSLELTVYQCL